MFPPPSPNAVGVCNQITLLILYYISSRLVTFRKVNDAPIRVPNIFYFTVSFKFLNFSSQIFLPFFFFFLKCLLTSHLTLFVLTTLLWLGFCTLLFCFLWSEKRKHSSSNHGLCCFSSYRPRLYLAEVLIFSLMFSQALFMSSPTLKFSKATYLFVISI